jgi:predicted Zn-dependent protease
MPVPDNVKTSFIAAYSSPAAIRAAKEATRRAPNNWTAWVALAEAEKAGGQRAAALAAGHRAHALNPRASAL